MNVPIFTRFITLSFLCISAMALLIGFTLASVLIQAPAAWVWQDTAWSIALAGGMALCLVLFLLLRAYAQSLAEMAQRSQVLVEGIAAHKRFEEALAERTTRLEAVRDVAVEITRELDLTTLLGLIIRRAVDLVGTQSGVVYLWDEATQVLIPQAWHGHEAWIREVRLGLGEGVVGTVAQRREGVIVEDYRTSRLAHPALQERNGATTLLAEPLLYRDRLVGVLVLLKPLGVGRPFAVGDRNLLMLFAAQAVIAIENARLHGTAVRRWEEVGALLRATHTVMADLALQGILTRIAEEASRIARTPHVRVLLVDKAAQVLRVRVSTDGLLPLGLEVPLGGGLSGIVAKTGKPLFVADTQSHPQNPFVEHHREHGIRTFLGLPIAIRDTGIGIPEAKQRLIFEPFTRSDGSTTRQYGGTGLGLTISRQLVALMGGQLWVESVVGQGSTLHFTARCGSQRQDVRQRAPAATARLRNVPGLIVDDNATNRCNLHALLTHWGMRPISVDSGPAALAMLAQAQDVGAAFPLVLLDAMMPEMDGFTLAAQIKKDPMLAETTIIMLTAGSEQRPRARCRELDIAAYLTKPVTQDELWDATLMTLGVISQTSVSALVTRHTVREHRQRLRVLLAEDNIVNQRLAVHLLEKWGHTVTVASTGKEALIALAQQSCDLVLMDVQMPEMDGLEATAAIRVQESGTETHIPIIAMTANAMQGDAEQCLAAGMDAYLAKPIRADDLFTAIDQLLQGELGHPRSAATPPTNLTTV